MVHKANQDDLDAGSYRSPFETSAKKDAEALRRVVDGEKPFASVVGPRHEIEALYGEAVGHEDLLVSKLEPGYRTDLDHVSFTVSVAGKLSDHFDMATLAEDYRRNDLPGVADHIESHKDKEFAAYHGRDDWDWPSAKWSAENPDPTQPWETGLILGYPVRNTLRRCYGVTGRLG